MHDLHALHFPAVASNLDTTLPLSKRPHTEITSPFSPEMLAPPTLLSHSGRITLPTGRNEHESDVDSALGTLSMITGAATYSADNASIATTRFMTEASDEFQVGNNNFIAITSE